MARPKDGNQPSTEGPVVVPSERVEPTAVSRDTPVTDAPEGQRELGGRGPNSERRDLGGTPQERTPASDHGTVEVVYDASAPTRVTLTIYPGTRLNVAEYQAAELLAASAQFRKATANDAKFPGLRAGEDGADQPRPGYDTDTPARRGAGSFDPAVVAANMPSSGEGNDRSQAYAGDVLKAARVSEEGIRSGRDVAATIVGPELPEETERG